MGLYGKIIRNHTLLGDQDVTTEFGDSSAVTNSTHLWIEGNICNIAELAQYLQLANETSIDAIIQIGIDKDGTDFLKKIDGNFVCVYWNSHKEELLIVRDKIGTKTLYYAAQYHTRGSFSSFTFASDLPTLQAKGISPILDGTMLLNYISDGITSHKTKNNATFFSNVLSLPAGHYLKIYPQKGKVQMRNYWRWNLAQQGAITDIVLPDVASQLEIMPANILNELSHLDISHAWQSYFSQLHEPAATISNFYIYVLLQQLQKIGEKLVISDVGAEMFGKNSFGLKSFFKGRFRKNKVHFFYLKNKLSPLNVKWQWADYIQIIFSKYYTKKEISRIIKRQLFKQGFDQKFVLNHQNEDSVTPFFAESFHSSVVDYVLHGSLESDVRSLNYISSLAVQNMQLPFVNSTFIQSILSLNEDTIECEMYKLFWLDTASEKYSNLSVLLKSESIQKSLDELSRETFLRAFSEAFELLVSQKILKPSSFEKYIQLLGSSANEVGWRVINIAQIIRCIQK